MRTVPSLLSMLDDPAAAPPPSPPLPAPVMPWDYVQMRRLAAGKTIEQAAKPYWHRPEHQADVERNFRTLEQPGYRAERHRFGGDKSRSYRISETVYRQLCDYTPEQHPRICRCCGWDEWSSQLDAKGFDCTWSADDPEICTLCEQTNRQKFTARPANDQPSTDTRCADQRTA